MWDSVTHEGARRDGQNVKNMQTVQFGEATERLLLLQKSPKRRSGEELHVLLQVLRQKEKAQSKDVSSLEHLVPLGGARLDQRQHGFAISVWKMGRLFRDKLRTCGAALLYLI